MQPGRAALPPAVRRDLAPERLLYLAIAVGEEHAKPARENSEYVMPDIDVSAGVGNADPWVVSAALFMARKQDIDLDVGDLLERWQGPMAWDDVMHRAGSAVPCERSTDAIDGFSAFPPRWRSSTR